jgi:hypothetical protein
MRPATRKPLGLLALLAATALVAAGCGEGHKLEVKEGEPLKLGDLTYNIQLTRFLNPMGIENKGDAPASIPTDFVIEDTQKAVYKPIPTKGPFSLALGSKIGAHETIPVSDSTPANGPIQGAMVLFLIKDASTENRPLKLTVPGPGEHGLVTLDI